MPQTARDIIDDAFAVLGVKAAETALTAFEIQDGLRFLNDMLAAWQGAYVGLGASPVDGESDNIRVQRWAIQHLKFELALVLASVYEKEISATKTVGIKKAEDLFNKQVVSHIDVVYPSSLPIGTGGRCNQFGLRRRFFPRQLKRNF